MMTVEQYSENGGEYTDQDRISTVLKNDEDRRSAYESREFSEPFLNLVFKNGRPKIITVDVFDTLLLRGDESEIKRFKDIADLQANYLMGMNHKEYDGDDLLAARLSATKTSYRASSIKQGCREGSILDIYRILVSYCLGLPENIANDLLDIELDYEERVLKLNTGLFGLLEELKRGGSDIVLVSDMYLHQEHIEALVNRICPQYREVVSGVISSADTTVSKASGKLFDLLNVKKGWGYDSWVHIGDAERGDVLRPEQRGINAIYLPISNRSLKNRSVCEKNMRDILRPRGLDHKMFNT